MQAFNDKARPPPARNHQKELVSLFNRLSGRRSHWQAFADFCELAAITFSNAVDLAQREQREARYLQIVKGYDRQEVEMFAQGLAYLTLALAEQGGDVLGRTFHDLELHNKWAGQFFTPDDVCRMMAQMTLGEAVDLQVRIAERGFVTAQEPAVGSGAMVIALAQAMREAGVNYQQHLHVTAIDIDPKCVQMAYTQFSLLYIPAVVIHGDTLRLTEYSRWYTPAHILDGWDWKLRQREALERAQELLSAPLSTDATLTVPAAAPVAAPAPTGPARQLTLF